MPLYEYDCHNCQKLVTVLFLSFSEAEKKSAVCPHCGGSDLTRRLPSRVSVVSGNTRSVGQTSAASTTQAGVKKEDPKELAFEMRQASAKAGRDMGQEFNEVASRLEQGESPSSIESSLRKRIGKDQKVH